MSGLINFFPEIIDKELQKKKTKKNKKCTFLSQCLWQRQIRYLLSGLWGKSDKVHANKHLQKSPADIYTAGLLLRASNEHDPRDRVTGAGEDEAPVMVLSQELVWPLRGLIKYTRLWWHFIIQPEVYSVKSLCESDTNKILKRFLPGSWWRPLSRLLGCDLYWHCKLRAVLPSVTTTATKYVWRTRILRRDYTSRTEW